MTSLLYYDAIARSRPQVQRLRRKYKRKNTLVSAVLGKGDGNDPYTGAGNNRIWVRRDAAADEDGNATLMSPEKVFCGSANYHVYDGMRVWLGLDPNGLWQVVQADNTHAEGAGLHTGILNAGNPTKTWKRLRNITNLKVLPVGTADNASTLVSAHGIPIYDNNYGDATLFTGTGLQAEKLDLSSDIPTSGNHAVVVVWLDTINNELYSTSSTAQVLATDLDETDYQEAFAERRPESVPIQGFHLGDGQTSITQQDLGEDVRQFINMPRVLGFPNPVDIQHIIRSGQTETVTGTLFITDTLFIHGTLFNVDFSDLASFDDLYVNVSGDIMTGDLEMQADNIGVEFGAGKDMDIGYNGAAGYIRTDLVAASDLDIDCGTDKTIELQETVWDDLRTPASAVRLAGAQPPSEVAYKDGMVLSFPSNADKTIYFDWQLPHTYKEGTDIIVHLHWTIPTSGGGGGAENVKWDLTYSWANINATFPASSSGTVTVDVQNDVLDDHMVDTIVTITGTGKTISSMLKCSLTRDVSVANDYADAAYFHEIDAHHEKDTLGSRQETAK